MSICRGKETRICLEMQGSAERRTLGKRAWYRFSPPGRGRYDGRRRLLIFLTGSRTNAMAYFADLTSYSYGPVEPDVLNVGWLGKGNTFCVGPTPVAFREALRELCQRPINKHRGYHVCEFCKLADPRKGNGQIRVMDQLGRVFVAPTMILHYVEAHQYLPPEVFIAAVLNPRTTSLDGLGDWVLNERKNADWRIETN